MRFGGSDAVNITAEPKLLEPRRLPGWRLLDSYVPQCRDVSRQRFLTSRISVQADKVGQEVRIILRTQATGIALRHHRGHEFQDIAGRLARVVSSVTSPDSGDT